MELVILGAAAVIVVVVLVLRMQRRAATRRTDALRTTAIDMGFAFEAEADLSQVAALVALPLFDRGHSKTVTNVMTGRAGGRDVKLFDYKYTTGGGKESHTWRQTVALYPGAGRNLPDFVLAPEGVFAKVAQIFGYQDIDFDSNVVFSKRYLLRGPDETAIRAAFGADRLAFFESQPGWTVEVRSGSIGIYRSGHRADPGQVPAFLAESQALLAALLHG